MRDHYLATYDAEEALKYDQWVHALTSEDHDACLSDLEDHVAFLNDMAVLDVGSGTGGLCLALVRIPGLQITALEPCRPMSDLLESKPELSCVSTVRGFCDHADDQSYFAAQSFDLIASRQLVNGLYDPMAAFRNWHTWLRSGGSVVVIDGLFDRSGWSGRWGSFVDKLPLAACRTTATVPYLLEQTGFRIDHVGMMDRTNAMASTRTPKYMVVATKLD